jgi:hypothetical protein
MSKKQKPQVTTQQNTVDPMVSRMQQKTMDTANRILDPYLNAGQTGYGVAGFNTDQNTAFEGIRGLTGGITPMDVKGWMNPYTTEVVDATTQRMRDEADRSANALRARGAAGSAFGGMGARTALGIAENERNHQAQRAEMTAKLLAQGYDQATATAITNQNLKATALSGVLGIGNQQQELEQRKLDVPLTALKTLHGMTPQQYSSTSTTTAPSTAPSPFQQVLGLAGTIGGAVLGGPMGASLGGSLGGMLGGGYTPAQHPMAQPNLYQQPIGPGW